MKKTFKILSFVLALVMCFSSIGLSAYAAVGDSGYNDWWNGEPQEWWYEDTSWWWEIADGWYYNSMASTHYDSENKTLYVLRDGGDICMYTDFFYGHFDWAEEPAPKDVEHIVFTEGCLGVKIGFNDLPELRDVTFLGNFSVIYHAFNNCPKLSKVVSRYYRQINDIYEIAPSIVNSFNCCNSDGVLFYCINDDDILEPRKSGTLIFKSYTYSKRDVDNVKISNTAKGVEISWDSNVNTNKVIVKKSKLQSPDWNSEYDERESLPGTYMDSIIDTNVKSGTKYYYWVGDCEVKAEITYLSQPVITSCVSTASNKATVKWKKVEGAKGYYVYRSTTGKKGSWTKIANLKSDKLSYTASGLKVDTKYYICVKAYSGDSVSSGATKTVNVGVPEITLAKTDGNYINLKWRKQSDTVYYRVYTKAPGSDKYTTAATIKDANKTSCKVKVASKKGTAIKVRAFYKSGKKTVYATTSLYKVGY